MRCHPDRRAARMVAAAALTILVTFAPAGVAMARQGVYGGNTQTGDPIVITSDAKAKKLTGIAFRVKVVGQDDWWAVGERAKARRAPANPNLLPVGALVTTRNGHGRFAPRRSCRHRLTPLWSSRFTSPAR